MKRESGATVKKVQKPKPPAKPKAPSVLYAAFLFIPGREFVLMGATHPSVAAAKAHLEACVSDKPHFRDATELWVVEVKARSMRRFAAEWT